VTRNAILAAVLLQLACCGHESANGRNGPDPCVAIGQRVTERLKASEPDRSRLHSLLERNNFTAEYFIAVSDLQGTHTAAQRFGSPCLTYEIAPECLTQPVPMRRDDVDELFSNTRTLAKGFLGEGPCAGPIRQSPSERCHRFGVQLEMESSAPDDSEMIAAWPGQNPVGPLSLPSQRALARVAEWRALLDYAGAVLPSCFGEKVRASCAHLTRGATSATPAELLAAVTQLAKAFQAGDVCEAPQK
jgi:hypothetical protein